MVFYFDHRRHSLPNAAAHRSLLTANDGTLCYVARLILCQCHPTGADIPLTINYELAGVLLRNDVGVDGGV